MLKWTACIVVLLFVSIEGAVSTAMVVAQRVVPMGWTRPASYDQYLSQPRYQTADGVEYWREFQRSTESEYVDGLIWRRNDFTGRFINVTDGIRLSPTSGHEQSNRAVFGGSAVWGTGVADAETVPAYLHADNYGEGGYNSTQNFIRFAQVVRDRIPIRTAIFYQGVNDVQAGCIDPGIVGATLLHRVLEPKFDRNPWALLRLQEIELKIAGRYMQPFHAHACEPGQAREVAETLDRTWELTDQLAEANGIEALFVLQPVHSNDPSYANVYQYVHPHVRQFRNLSDLSIQASDWIDFSHLSLEGNARVAAEIRDVEIEAHHVRFSHVQ